MTGSSPASALERRFLGLIAKNPYNRVLIERLPQLALPDVWLVSGCLFQTAWNVIDGEAPTRGIRDYDIFYFDPDLSWEAEDRCIKRAGELFADLGIEIELRNQARVHLWYQRKFGSACPQFHSACEGIDNFLNTFSMVGVQPAHQGLRLYAPLGLADVFDRVMRPNPRRHGGAGRERYEEKAKRWQALWPSLKVLPWDAAA